MSYRYDFSVYITVIKYRPQENSLAGMPPKTDKSKRQVCRSALHLHFAACKSLYIVLRFAIFLSWQLNSNVD